MEVHGSSTDIKLAWVQALRGIAALMVVATHARYYLDGTAWQSFGERYLRPGAQGVDLFFFVSGFIMVRLFRFGGRVSRDATERG